jgi:hypothetical protein
MSLTPTAQRVLAALQEAGKYGRATNQLCQPDVGGVRFGARILDLRRAGYLIREERIRTGQSRYVLDPQEEEPIVLDFCTGMYDSCREDAA